MFVMVASAKFTSRVSFFCILFDSSVFWIMTTTAEDSVFADNFGAVRD